MGTVIKVKSKSVSDPSEISDGLRILVDRFWPRGIRKSDLHYDLWAKDITPSDELRKFFHSDPVSNWISFKAQYEKQLLNSDSLDRLACDIRKTNPECITLLYAYNNKIKNHALILKDILDKKLNTDI